MARVFVGLGGDIRPRQNKRGRSEDLLFLAATWYGLFEIVDNLPGGGARGVQFTDPHSFKLFYILLRDNAAPENEDVAGSLLLQ